MTLEKILGKFVSGRIMVKEARYVDDIANRPLPLYEPHPLLSRQQTPRRHYLTRWLLGAFGFRRSSKT